MKNVDVITPFASFHFSLVPEFMWDDWWNNMYSETPVIMDAIEENIMGLIGRFESE